jgi:hypothetical protein
MAFEKKSDLMNLTENLGSFPGLCAVFREEIR